MLYLLIYLLRFLVLTNKNHESDSVQGNIMKWGTVTRPSTKYEN